MGSLKRIGGDKQPLGPGPPGLVPGADQTSKPGASLRIRADTAYRKRHLSRIIEARRRVVIGPETEHRDGVAIEQTCGQSELAGNAQEATNVADPRLGHAELKERFRVKRQPEIEAAEDVPHGRSLAARLVARRRGEEPVDDVGIEGACVVTPDVHAYTGCHLLAHDGARKFAATHRAE